MIKAIHNGWKGEDEGFENDAKCDYCGNLGHVATFPIPPFLLAALEVPVEESINIRICTNCLHLGIVEIYRAIHGRIPNAKYPTNQTETGTGKGKIPTNP